MAPAHLELDYDHLNESSMVRTTEGCSATYEEGTRLFLVGTTRTEESEELLSWLRAVKSVDAARGLLDPDAEPAWVGGISTPARRSALLVFADQRRADRPDATFEIVGQPAEHGASAEIQVAVQSAAHCETSFWQLVLLDIDSGVTALDSAERTERKESEGCANEE